MLTLSHFTGGIAQTNGWLVQLAGHAIAIDAPEGMATWLAARDIRLDALLLTHQHFDHVLDAAAIAASHACPVIAFAAYSTDLTLERLFGISTGISLSVPPFNVTHLVTESSSLDLLGSAWSILHVPGHSPDSICFHAPSTGHLFGGDVLFRDGIGRTDFPGGSSRTLLHGIQSKILTLPDDTQVHPGHGPSTTIARERLQNPFLLDD
jgi:hydroxyacylglutathione hydrolase